MRWHFRRVRGGVNHVIVTDMLVAVLNSCSKEELEELEEEVPPQPTHAEDSVERRKVIKNKILAVGRMARVFALLRCVASFDIVPDDSSVLQRRIGKGRRVEEYIWFCQIAIWNTRIGHRGNQRCHFRFRRRVRLLLFFSNPRSSPPRRKSDIENERLPPELFDAEEAKAFLAQHAHSQSLPETPSMGDLSFATSGSIEATIEAALSSASLVSSQSNSSVGGPSTPTSPTSSPNKVPFRGRHGRQASLGTTRTSPSTRRRSLESTISMIQEALDGKDLEAMAGEPATGAAGGGSGGYFAGSRESG